MKQTTLERKYKIPKQLEGLAKYAKKFPTNEKFVNAVWFYLNINPKTQMRYTFEESVARGSGLPKTTKDLTWFELNYQKQMGRGKGWFGEMAEFWEASKSKKAVAI